MNSWRTKVANEDFKIPMVPLSTLGANTYEKGNDQQQHAFNFLFSDILISFV